jgi:hypothetical protein
MSENAHKAHPVPAIILAVILAALMGWILSLGNADQKLGCWIAAGILALIGVFGSLVLGRK